MESSGAADGACFAGSVGVDGGAVAEVVVVAGWGDVGVDAVEVELVDAYVEGVVLVDIEVVVRGIMWTWKLCEWRLWNQRLWNQRLWKW